MWSVTSKILKNITNDTGQWKDGQRNKCEANATFLKGDCSYIPGKVEFKKEELNWKTLHGI